MLRNCDEDSGRSSCSATSVGLSPIMTCRDSNTGDLQQVVKRYTARSQDDLKVSSRPRSCVFSSPDERDPFPSRKHPGDSKNVLSIFDGPRKGGLSSAHSTYDIVTSTQIENSQMQGGALSFNHIATADSKPINTNFKRIRPVQRVASRLYRADCGIKGKEGCIGPEFVVRATQPPKQMDLTLSALPEKRLITVILLNGQKFEIKCDSYTVTAGQIFEALIKSEKYEHNFMLGMAALIGGDFIFLPDDYKIKKVAPEGWHKPNKKQKYVEHIAVTLYMRIKFFLPTNIAQMVQGGEWRHRVYLQLRRATVEGQLSSTIQNLILLTGYALHIEFGDFTFREHGIADYFLLEHYLPEHVITNNVADIKLRMKRAHESRRGLDRNRAILNFISLAQTFRDYGSHFYSAIWATRDGFCRDVWLSIGPKGVTLYSRNNHISEDEQCTSNRIVLQSLPWHHIHTFYYNKKSLYLMPNSYSGLSKMGVKYKLRMADNKSYFTFWLASLHHRLYLKLYAREDFMSFLSNELGTPLNLDGSPKSSDCSNYQDSYNLAVRQPLRVRRPIRRRFKVDFFGDKKAQNKENHKPTTEELLRQILLPLSDESFTNAGNSSNDCVSSSESCSLPRRHGVKMGTRVFNGIKTGLHSKSIKSNLSEIDGLEGELATAQSDSDDQKTCSINSMKLLPERSYNQAMCHTATAYVLESPRVYPEASLIANESCANMSLVEKLDNLGCVQGERVFVTANLERNQGKALGLQVAEGSDGNVYIKSISPGGPADLCKKLLPGDQIISVNGQTLLNVKYDRALTMLQTAPKKVELIVLQNVSKNTLVDYVQCGDSSDKSNFRHSMASALNVDLTDDELLNEEALKTIYALIKITKEKVLNRIKDTNRPNASNENNLQKCHSENKLYLETDVDNFSSQEITPVRDSEKFNTWRGDLSKGKPKRRPLSLSIPSEVLPENYLDESEELLKQTSLKSIQSTLNSDKSKLSSGSFKNVALPRNYAVSRKWLGPVRYPVTPCKNSVTNDNSMSDVSLVKNHYNYGVEDSDDDQIFL